MALATADGWGMPDVRMVLLKDAIPAGASVFYSNAESRKGRQLAANGQAALCFRWKSLRRQVRIAGQVSGEVSAAEADAYFATRARTARWGLGRLTSRGRWRVGSSWRSGSRGLLP